MRQKWLKFAEWVNALSLRERGILFVVFILGSLALADVVWLTPAQNAYKTATLDFESQNGELKRLRAELQSTAQTVDPSKVVRDEMALADVQLSQINQSIGLLAPQAGNGPRLEDVLLQFLRRQDGLALLSTGTFKPDQSNQATSFVAVPGMTKRGMELRVSGAFGDLARYVQTLERALPNLRWGQLQLKSEKQPPELTLQVYVVGVQP